MHPSNDWRNDYPPMISDAEYAGGSDDDDLTPLGEGCFALGCVIVGCLILFSIAFVVGSAFLQWVFL